MPISADRPNRRRAPPAITTSRPPSPPSARSPGALALSVGEAQVYGGVARGSFGIARSDAVADVKAQFQFTDVDLQACASELFGVTKLSGRGNLNVSLVASGSSPFGLAQSLDGTV